MCVCVTERGSERDEINFNVRAHTHMSLHVCVYLRARLPACVSATGTGQCLITANIQGAAAASSNCLVALFTHWRIY